MLQGPPYFQEPQEVREGRGSQGRLGMKSPSQASPALSSAGPKMVAVQNYHGNPAPAGKPALTFQMGDVIELLRGDPESQWWEVGPGRTSPPAAPSSLPRAEGESPAFAGRGGCGVLDHQTEGGGLFAGPGCQGVCLDMAGGAASPRQRHRRRPSPFPAAPGLGCVLFIQATPLPPSVPARPNPGQHHRAQCWGHSRPEAPHSRPPGDAGPRDGLWF